MISHDYDSCDFVIKLHRILMTQKLLAAVSKDRKIIANTFSNNQLFDQLIYHLQQTFQSVAHLNATESKIHFENETMSSNQGAFTR